MASEVSSMTLALDRTCRLKFPVVAEELIEYSGARHGAAFSSNLGGKTLDFGGKTFAVAGTVVVVVIEKCVRKDGRDATANFLCSPDEKKSRPPYFTYLLLLVPAIKTTVKLFIKKDPPREC